MSMDGENLFRKFDVTDPVSEYDSQAKMLIAEKVVLAHILAYTLDEFKGVEPESIIPLIEGEPQISKIPVLPGETNNPRLIKGNDNPEITGSNTEDNVPDESKITFDVRFFVWTPDESNRVKLLIDVEAQKNFDPGYDIVTRGGYYSSRMISSQYGREFYKAAYDGIKKVYSIFICLNCPEIVANTAIGFYTGPVSIVGEIPNYVFRYDISNVILICLSEDVAGTDLKLHRFLNTLFSKEKPSVKKSRLEKEYGITVPESMERSINIMCNLGQGILEQGRIDTLVEIIGNLMKSTGKTLEQVMDMMDVPAGDRGACITRLSK